VTASILTGCSESASPVPIDPNGPPVAIRPEHLTVQPSTGPLTHVRVQNLHDARYEGTIHVTPPGGWKLDSTSKPVTIEPGALARVAFAIEKGTDSPDNTYRMNVRAVGGDREVVWDGSVVAVTSPYMTPEIDGEVDEWDDAVPFVFEAGGKATTVSSYWNRRHLSLLVAVVEDTHTPMTSTPAPFDAVQIALARGEAVTPRSSSEPSQRYELLIAATDSGGKCFLLIEPGDPLTVAEQSRPLKGLEVDDARVFVVRRDGKTHYECAIPLKRMPGIRAEPGREHCFSILVHDPDGTGIRDWGAAAGLWPWQRNALAWCRWQGAAWPEAPLYDSKIEWAFCSSRR